MSTTLTIPFKEARQLEPQKNLVESTPVKDSKKLSLNAVPFGSIQGLTWEDLRGLTWTVGEKFYMSLFTFLRRHNLLENHLSRKFNKRNVLQFDEELLNAYK